MYRFKRFADLRLSLYQILPVHVTVRCPTPVNIDRWHRPREREESFRDLSNCHRQPIDFLSNEFCRFLPTVWKAFSRAPDGGMTNYCIGLHRTTSDQIWLNEERLHWPRSACIPVVNHALAPCTGSRKCLTYMMLEKNRLFHAAAVQSAERVPSGLQSPGRRRGQPFSTWSLHVAWIYMVSVHTSSM